MLRDTTPFVLLDDCRTDGGPTRLYRDPVDIIAATSIDAVGPALDRVHRALAAGRHVAGFMGYGGGLALEPKLAALAERTGPDDPPVLWFGVFDDVELLDAQAVDGLLPDPRGALTTTPVPRVTRADYDAAFAQVSAYIHAGDIYQANLSFRADLRVFGHPLALYARLRSSAAAGWGGAVFTGRHWLLSASPELFFTLDDGAIVARPMKGTARRGATPAEDAVAAAALADDPKERAENLMIVDLLRNDLSRVAVPGTVAVPALFTIETYPTLHTLTSTITARLTPSSDAIDLLSATFPCGSVTGAPKLRAMQVIAEVEHDARGVYTGSIGWIGPDGDAAFNVAIRTLVVRDAARADGGGDAVIGLGSAVVADSTAAAEWDECLAKAAFIPHGAPEFDLIETMRFDPALGVAALGRHQARLRSSATALDFLVPADLETQVATAVAGLTAPARLRLLLSRDGGVQIETAPLPAAPREPVSVAVVPLPVDVDDFRLCHKTTDRGFYDAARTASHAFEVVFERPDGLLTEGSITSIFVERDGRLLTPPRARGLLPGVLRQRLIDEGRADEADLTIADLAGGFLIGNAMRGLIRATLATDGDLPGPNR